MKRSWRQWWYPGALRIRSGEAETDLLLVEVDAMLRELASVPAATTPPGPAANPVPSAEAGPALDKAFAVALCNGLFRLETSAGRMKSQSVPEAERVAGHLDRLRGDLQQQGITYQDLSGQRFDVDRKDFEIMGEPQPSPAVAWPTIARCERPLVQMQGKVLQRAKGVVTVPAGR